MKQKYTYNYTKTTIKRAKAEVNFVTNAVDAAKKLNFFYLSCNIFLFFSYI